MNVFILLIVTKAISVAPADFKMIEFQSRGACEVALAEAKSFWATVNDESKCIDVGREIKVNALKEQLKKVQQ